MSNTNESTGTVEVKDHATVQGTVIGVNLGSVTHISHYHSTSSSIAVPHQLPAPLNDFVGRTDTLAEVLAELQTQSSTPAPVCAICGMGGLGKTQLAIRAAHFLVDDYPDAQLFVSLGGSAASQIRSAEDALRYLIRIFEPTALLPDDLPTLAARYSGHLQGKRILILLDDAPDDASARWFLPPPGSALLVTSRRYITVGGQAKTLRLAFFRREESRRLLLDDAPHLKGDPALDAILDHCSDLPLAVRVAAATLATNEALTPKNFLAQLADEKQRLNALRYDEDWDVFAILGLSDDLLMASEPALARRWRILGICATPFDAQAAGAIWHEPDDFGRDKALNDLVRRSLLTFNQTTQLYQMHDLLRDVARQRRTIYGPEDEVQARIRYATHYLNIAREANRLFVQGGELASNGLQLFDAVGLHIRAAAAWVARHPRPETEQLYTGPPLGSSILEIRAQPYELVVWYQAAVEALRRLGYQKQAAYTLAALGASYLLSGEAQQARKSYEESLVIFRELKDRHGEAIARHGLGQVLSLTGKWKAAEKLYRQALKLAHKLNDQYLLAHCRGALGHLLANQDAPEEALNLLQQAVTGFTTLDNTFGLNRALQQLSDAYILHGNFDQALGYAEQLLQLAQVQGDQVRISDAFTYIGIVRAQRGDLPQALDMLQKAIDNNAKLGYIQGTIGSRSDIAGVYNLLGDYRHAMENLQQALRDALLIGYLRPVGFLSGNAGELYRQQGDFEQALFCYRIGLQIALELNDRPSMTTTLSNIAVILTEQGQLRVAEQLYQYTIKQWQRLGNESSLCEDLHHLVRIYEQQQHYLEAQRLSDKALNIAQKSQRSDIEFEVALNTICLRYARGQVNRTDTIGELEIFAAKWQQPLEQAAVHYAKWEIDPALISSQQIAAMLYHDLYITTPNMLYWRRYEKLTGEHLPSPPTFPTLQIPKEHQPAELVELLTQVSMDISDLLLKSSSFSPT